MLKEKLCLTPFSCPPFLFSLHRLSRVMESRTSEICFASLCHSILVMQFSILSHWLLFLLICWIGGQDNCGIVLSGQASPLLHILLLLIFSYLFYYIPLNGVHLYIS